MKMWTAFLIFIVCQVGWGKPIQYVVEGADEKTGRVIREIIAREMSSGSTLDHMQRALEQIYELGHFADAEVYVDDRPDKMEIIFKVSPLRIVKYIAFSGNNAFSRSELLPELGITEGDSYASEKVRSAVESVKKYYNLHGYLNAQVEGQFTDSPQGVTFNIVVSEGNPCVVTALKITSLNSRLNRDLQEKFKGKKNDIFTQSFLGELQEELSTELFKEGYYGATLTPPIIEYNALKSGVSLIYEVNDPYMYVLVFEGNSTFNETKIRKELNINPASRLSTSPIDDLAERVVRFYKRSGYADVAVHIKENVFAQDFIRRVTFTITEGTRIKISDIHIEGSYSKPESYYKDFLFDRSGDLIYGHIYDAEDFDNGVKNLVTDLQNQGFISAKVLGTRVDFSKRRDSVSVTVVLAEGPQTLIKNVTFEGRKNVTKEELEETTQLKEGQPLQLKAVEDSVNNIVNLYKSKGYLDARIANQGKSIITYSDDNTAASLNFQIKEGAQVVVASVIIEGNSFTKEHVIRRELQFEPDDVLTPEKIAYSEQRLQRLGFLGNVEIHTVETSPEQSRRTVVVHVEEKDPGVFRAGVGANNDAGFTVKGFVSGGYSNLWGTGRGINVRFDVADRIQYQFFDNSITVGYIEPYIFDTKNTAKVNLIHSQKLYAVITNQNSLPSGYPTPTQGPNYQFAIDNTQADTVIERDLSKNLKLIMETYGIAHINIFETQNKEPSAPLDIGTLGPRLIFDRRDDPFNPTRGELANLNVELSSPYIGSTSTVAYYRLDGSVTKYIPLGKWVWANQARGGYLYNFSKAQNGGVPAIKAFELGGETTLRGFNPITEGIPRITAFPAPNLVPLVPIDSALALFKTEIRFPIFGNIQGAVFYDGGMVTLPGAITATSVTPLIPFKWRDDVGVGLRYKTPFGPINAEYAQKLNPAPGENGGQFWFSIGTF